MFQTNLSHGDLSHGFGFFISCEHCKTHTHVFDNDFQFVATALQHDSAAQNQWHKMNASTTSWALNSDLVAKLLKMD